MANYPLHGDRVVLAPSLKHLTGLFPNAQTFLNGDFSGDVIELT
jgi:hypothetical protein